MKQYKKLAASVIVQAARDFVFVAEKNKQDQKNISKSECYNFLTCKTQIGKFWFEVAGIIPFRDLGHDKLYHALKEFI